MHEEYYENNNKQASNLIKSNTKILLNALEGNTATTYKHYRRGSVIKVDFGFNMGHELGGVHYAIVITNKDNKYASNIAVVPLTSKKEHSKIGKFDIDLGKELYYNIENAIEMRDRDLFRCNLYRPRIEAEMRLFEHEFGNNPVKLSDINFDKYENIRLFLLLDSKDEDFIDVNFIKYKKRGFEFFYDKTAKANRNIRKEFLYLKPESIAKVDQLKSISKSRIVNPVSNYDALFKVKLFDTSLDKINKKIKSLIVFDKQ